MELQKPVSIVNQDTNKLFLKCSESKINKQEVFFLLWNNTDFPVITDHLPFWNEWQKTVWIQNFFFLFFLVRHTHKNTSLPSSVCSIQLHVYWWVLMSLSIDVKPQANLFILVSTQYIVQPDLTEYKVYHHWILTVKKKNNP